MSDRVIVVGVDGSDASAVALQWAVDEASLRSAVLRVVYAWHFPLLAGVTPVPSSPTVGDMRSAGADIIDKLLANAELGEVKVSPAVLEGDAAEVLVTASESAELLVVGSRGRGGFAGLLLGSVGQKCAQHAHCPVVIVRGE